MPSIAYTIDVHEDTWFALHLGGAHEALPEGDFKIASEDKVWLVERKTWGDAYSSFRSKRLEDQLSRMLLATPNTILLIEGRKEAVYTNDRQQIKNLQAFLNRMSAEVCPVVYTDGKEDSLRWLKAIGQRIENDQFGVLVRKPTMVASSRNKHHALLESIPGVGRATAKKIYNHYDNLVGMVNNWDIAQRVGIVGIKRWEDVNNFINAEWGEAVRKPLSSKTENEQPTFEDLT